MAYTNFTNCTEQEYLDIIYSQDDTNRIKIWFNNVELSNADEYCESLTGTNRILPNDGSKRFSLDNFVAKEYTLILRDLPNGTTIEDQVRISIGTLVDENNNTYEDVPIGIFNIQDTPTTDNNKITIKLRDNRVKFDFYYNAKPLLDLNDGTATKKQILNDICTQASVTNTITTFEGENDLIGIYDNSIKATTYVSYILEQAGLIPTIDRLGQLAKIDLTNLKTWKISLDLLEKYEKGDVYQIDRVVYESGIIKYESSNDETLDTLYLDSANPYINNQSQIDYIYNLLKNFEIDSVTTGNVLGNPAIDPYDLIQVYGYYEEDEDGNEVFVDDDSVIVFTTLANNTYTYKGNQRQQFDTQIGKEERTENVSISSQANAKKIAKTEIDNVNGVVTILASNQDDLEGRVSQTEIDVDTERARVDVMSRNIDENGNILELKRMDYELGANGFIIDDGSGYKSIDNTTGKYFFDNDTMVGKYTKDGSVQKDMALFGKYYYGIDENLDVANFTKDNAMFIAQRITVQWTDENNVIHTKVGMGHFNNQ